MEANKNKILEALQMQPLSEEEMDAIYTLPYMRDYHPSYEKSGGVPAIKEVKFSIVHNRGCFGACNFCSIAYHQGRQIAVRSHESVLREAEILTRLPDFKGYIHDVGGPTANFRAPSCKKQLKCGVCKDRQCLLPLRRRRMCTQGIPRPVRGQGSVGHRYAHRT